MMAINIFLVIMVALAGLDSCSSWTSQGLTCRPRVGRGVKAPPVTIRLSAMPVPGDPDVLMKAVSSSVSAAKGAFGQVTILMWTRTAMNYQYKFGGTFGESISSLVEEGGVGRLYSGIGFALLQVPTR